MKVVVIVLLACVYCVYSERCSNATTCVGTTCVSTAAHVHVQCIEAHCTCSEDKLPCITLPDCHKGVCIDRHGHHSEWHCVDASCQCIPPHP